MEEEEDSDRKCEKSPTGSILKISFVQRSHDMVHIGPSMRKPVFWECEQQKRGPSAHPHSLASAYAIRLQEIIIAKLASNKIYYF